MNGSYPPAPPDGEGFQEHAFRINRMMAAHRERQVARRTGKIRTNTLKREYAMPASRRQRTIWFISKIGSRMASTMSSTTPPMTRINSGSSSAVSVSTRPSSSRVC